MNIKKTSIILAVVVLIGAVSFLYYLNQASEVVAPEQPMYQATSKDGTKISYIKSGKGPVVVLVGGALQTKSDKVMAGLMPLLSNDFTVVSYDRRGRGESSDAGNYTPEREIEDLEAVIAEVGDSLAYVFGNSSGGNLVLIAAAKLSGIQKVAVYEAPFISDAQLGSAKEYIADLQEANTNNDPGKALKLFFKRIGVPSPIVLGMSFTPMWSGLKAVAPTLVYDAIIVGDGSVPKELGTISVPVLALTGSDDRMKLAAKSLVAVVPHATHQVLEGQTHDVKPDVLAQVLSTFFK